PDCVERRPAENARLIERLYGVEKSRLRHLDYGGGTGLLSKLLREQGWNSVSFDPFFDRGAKPESLGRFNFITPLEVFDHVPGVRRLMADLAALLAEDGLIFFSTLLTDGHIAPGKPLEWWYAGPRNGHISLYSKKSLATLAGTQGFRVGNMNEVAHVMCRAIP